jgi:hypothetical protein
MATLNEIQTFALGNPQLQQRFRASRIQAAWDILAEGSPSANRVAWRNKILTNPDADSMREYIWTLSHALIQSAGNAITDANLNIATKSFVDAWAALDATP